ncbi:MAG: TIGR00730 family Rossman fold protein [Spirochaetes bacterium]|jgi:uncharacterized protein (TIGR00730 family)|nr:TIGR00730 family Rossman fold protein [Spirochaetota bacterium]
MSLYSVNTLCVFCGSSDGDTPRYRDDAVELGRYCAAEGVTVVYGGGSVGLMGRLSDSVALNGGRVIGVIPELLHQAVQHNREVETIIVDTMHTRKARMYEQSDAFVALPGGIGTIEELFEVYTWQQIGYHQKPVALLNSDGYFDHLISFLDSMVSRKFLKPVHRANLIVANSVPLLFKKLADFDPGPASKF